jgi:hypothetical protein
MFIWMIFKISIYIVVKINMSDSIKYVGSVKVDIFGGRGTRGRGVLGEC